MLQKVLTGKNVGRRYKNNLLMSEHLHDMDDIFKSAYQEFEDEPTADVWGKINAKLDKKDTESYKKRSLKWKRVSLLLLLLLAGFILYETVINRASYRQFPKKFCHQETISNHG